jgi:predicted acylesterase/phospholipase RssA
MLVGTSGGAFVLAENSCGSWRAKAKTRANALKAQWRPKATYASTRIGVSIRAGQSTQRFNRFIPLLRRGAKRRFCFELAFAMLTNQSTQNKS